MTRSTVDHGILLEWRYRKTRYTNRATGMAILIHKRLAHSVRDVEMPPAALTGRCIAIRIRGEKRDYFVGSLHNLVLGSMRDKTHISYIEGMTGWMEGLVRRLPGRCVPIAKMDLNDRFGVRRDACGDKYTEADRHVGLEAVGLEAAGVEHAAARRLRHMLEDHDLAAVNTVSPVRITCYSEPNGTWRCSRRRRRRAQWERWRWRGEYPAAPRDERRARTALQADIAQLAAGPSLAGRRHGYVPYSELIGLCEPAARQGSCTTTMSRPSRARRGRHSPPPYSWAWNRRWSSSIAGRRRTRTSCGECSRRSRRRPATRWSWSW